MVRAKQFVFKDLIGDRNNPAAFNNFVFNLKDADPGVGDRIPFELYLHSLEKLVKYFDDVEDLRYIVPGIVKEVDPTDTDDDYIVGQEWHNTANSKTWKLLNKLEPEVLGSVDGSSSANPNEGTTFPITVQFFNPEVSGTVTLVRLLVKSTTDAGSLTLELNDPNPNSATSPGATIETATASYVNSSSPQVLDFVFSANNLITGNQYSISLPSGFGSTYVVERDEDLIANGSSLLASNYDAVLDLGIEITITPDETGAVWVELPRLIPEEEDPRLIRLTANLDDILVDYDNGDDVDGTATGKRFKTIKGAVDFINNTYDFDNGKYNYTITVITQTQPMSVTSVDAPVGARDQQFYIVGGDNIFSGSTKKELVMQNNHCFVCNTDLQLNIKNFKFSDGGGSRLSVVNGSKGRVTFEDNIISGNIARPFFQGGTFRVRATANNIIENLTAVSLVRVAYRSDYFQTGSFTAFGSNTFTEIFNLADNAIAYTNDSASFDLDQSDPLNPATVTGAAFAKYSNSSLRLATIDQLQPWADLPGSWYGGGLYRSRTFNHNYSHWVEGVAVSLNGDGNLAVTGGEVMILRSQGDKSLQYWSVNVFADQEITFPAILASVSEAWIYAADNETIEFLSEPPSASNLLQRVCLGKITTLDNTTIDTVQAEITERSPEFLDSLAPTATVHSCVISNALMTNLNDTIAGNAWVFDVSTFETSSNAIFSASSAGVTLGAPGVYLVKGDLNTSVPADGAQRPSVAIKGTVNGSQKVKAGRSGYIRRAGGHLKASSAVEYRVNVAAGDLIGMVGFRDAISGTVTAPAGESELIITKLS